MPFWVTRREGEDLRTQMEALKARQEPSHAAIEAVEKQLTQLEKNPLVSAAAAAERLEKDMPKWLRKPLRWLYIMLALGILGFATTLVTLIFLYRETEAIRDQTGVLSRQLDLQQQQLRQQRLMHDEQMERQASVLSAQESQIQTQREDTLAALRLQEKAVKMQTESNGLLQSQNEAFLAQVSQSKELLRETRRQIDNQIFDTNVVRRAQLLQSIYEEEPCDLEAVFSADVERLRTIFRKFGGDPEKEAQLFSPDRVRFDSSDRMQVARAKSLCSAVPIAPERVRQEAVLALARIDRHSLDLGGANLKDLRFVGADFRGARFIGADLTGASFRETALPYSNFSGSKLVEVRLEGADLTGAYLISADLTEASLQRADLSSARLSSATFIRTAVAGADLSTSVDLTQNQLNNMCGDSMTKIPSRLRRPKYWLDRPWEKYKDPWRFGCQPAVSPRQVEPSGSSGQASPAR